MRILECKAAHSELDLGSDKELTAFHEGLHGKITEKHTKCYRYKHRPHTHKTTKTRPEGNTTKS